MVYDEERYSEPSPYKTIIEFGSKNDKNYDIEFDGNGNMILRHLSMFTATLDHVVANGVLYSMWDDDWDEHKVDTDAWIKIREYMGLYNHDVVENCRDDYDIHAGRYDECTSSYVYY